MLSSRQFLAVISVVLVSMVSTSVFAAETDNRTTDDWYQWSLKGQPAGYFHAVRKASGEKEAPVLLMHKFVVNWHGKRLSLLTVTRCRDDAWLTPVRIGSKGEGDDEFMTYTGGIAWPPDPDAPGKLTVDVAGDQLRRIKLDLPRKTVTDFALFDIVRRLPFDKEKVFEFNCLEASELNLKKGHRLTYVGTEELELGGKKALLHKFEHSTDGRIVSVYWVNEDRQLVRLVMDERKEFLLTTEQKAKAALEQGAADR